jgi:hypothetical protein
MHIPPTKDQLTVATKELLTAICARTPPLRLLSHFSRTELVVIDHTPINAPHAYPATGLNAVRSYFDLLSTHWTCKSFERHETNVFPEAQQVVTKASVIWTWKHSGRSWTEEFTCTFDFDDQLKVKRFLVRTTSPPGTCVMMANESYEEEVPQVSPSFGPFSLT